jgi:hypothetical protein
VSSVEGSRMAISSALLDHEIAVDERRPFVSPPEDRAL